MVFISYKSEEYDIARRLRLMLEDNGYSCWMAPESIPGGSNYMHEIPKAIRKCDLFLLIVSETSQRSQWVQKEIDRAVKFNKQIIPFHADDSELIDAIDFVISNAQRIEAYHNFDQACDELLEAVRRAHPPINGADIAPKAARSGDTKSAADAIDPAVLAALAGGNSNLPPEVLMQLLDKLPPEYVAKLLPGAADNTPNMFVAPEVSETDFDVQSAWGDEDPFVFPDSEGIAGQMTWDEDPFAIPEPAPIAAPAIEPIVPPVAPAAAPIIPPIAPVAAPVVPPVAPVAAPAAVPVPPVAPTPAVPRAHTPTKISASSNSPLQRRAHEAIIMEIRTVYETNYVQNNPNGFKIKVDELVDYKPHRKEEGVVIIPYGVKKIGDSVFAKKKNVRCVVVPPTVEVIGPNAFLDCMNLEKVIFHEGLLTIGNNAFQNCVLLKKVTLPRSLREIGDFAFMGCPGLHAPIHKDVIQIGVAAFNGCEYVSVHSQNAAFYMHSKCIISKQDNRIVSAAADCQFPNNVNINIIGDYAFAGSLALWRLDIPENITRIGTRAFQGCINLKDVVIESSVEMVGKQAFADCSGLEAVVIKPGVQMIESQAFLHCRSLRNAPVPASIRYVAKDAFEGCPNLKK